MQNSGWDIHVVNTIRRAVCIVQYLPIFSFHLAINHPDPRLNRRVRYYSSLRWFADRVRRELE